MAGVGGISGLVTGLDTVDLISKMLDLERRPIINLQERISSNINLKSAYETLEAHLLALKIDSRNLVRRDIFKTIGAMSSNEDIMTASVNGSAATGSYTLSVSQLAQSHQIASLEFADKDETVVGTGTITINNGMASPVEITIDSSNNTLEKVASAINSSGAGVQAVIVNVGGDNASYKLLISGGSTGAVNSITIDEDLSGGTGLRIGEVGDFTNISWNGSSEVNAGGNYTGDDAATFTFTVANGGGGTIGSDTITLEYTDGDGISGTVTIPSSYTEGTSIHISGGLEITLGEGSIIDGDSFSIDVGSSTIQAATNAIFSLGSVTGGGTPVEMESASNTVTDLIENVTLELHQAQADTAVNINVEVDVDSMVADVETFVNRYSELVKFFNAHFTYDPEGGAGGELFGENFAIRLNQSVRQKVTNVVQGLGQQISSMAALGVRTANNGTLSIDTSVLRNAIAADPDSLVNLFSASGETTDTDIQFLVASANTQPTYMINEDGYDVIINVAAAQARMSASSIVDPSESSPLVIDSSNNSFSITLDGRESTSLSIASGSYTSGDELATAIEEAINSDDELAGSKISTEYVDDGGGNGHIEFTSLQYGSESTIEFGTIEENSIYSTIGVTSGEMARGINVSGTINGEEATGAGRHLVGNADNEYTSGLQVLVTISAEQLAVQGEDQGTVKVTKGVASRLTEYINELTELDTGAISSKKNALDSINETMENEMAQLSAKIDKKEKRLFDQFVKLETTISQFQAEENYLTSMITQLKQVTNYNRQ